MSSISTFLQTRVSGPLARFGRAAIASKKTVVVVLVGLVVAIGVAYVLIPPPKAYGGLKGHTVEMYRNGVFRVVFNQPMNRESAEKAFRIAPPLQGSFIWKGNVLTYTPLQDLEKGATYEIFVSDEAKSLLGKPIQKPFRQSFVVLDYPEVSVAAPVHDTEVDQSQALTVLFDHPIRNLTGSLDVPELLQIVPPVAGRYHWLGTTGFEFIPNDGWPAATEFTVTVPKGTKTADGGSTINDYTWKFRTPHLLFTSQVESDDRQNPEEPFRIQSNYPVNIGGLKAALQIQEASTTVPNDQFTFTLAKDDPTTVEVMKNGKYKLGNAYSFKLPSGFTGGYGPLGLTQDWLATVNTDELGFRLVAACPDNNQKKEVYDSVVFRFNNPVDQDKLKNTIRVVPPIEEMEVSPWGWSPDSRCQSPYGENRVISVSGKWKASTKYSITVPREFADIYKQTLNDDKVTVVETNMYRPSAELSSYSIYGVMASHLQRLYQIRAMNLKRPITVTLCSGSLDTYLKERSFDCALKATKIIDPSNALNIYKIIDLDLDALAGTKLPNGFYRLTMDIPELQEYQRSQTRELLIADTAITMKRDKANKLLVWATDMKTGGVVPNLPVEAYRSVTSYEDGDLTKVTSGKTDANGLAILDLGTTQLEQPIAVNATDGRRLGVAVSHWDDGVSPWNFNLEYSYRRFLKRHIGYLYTDRRIYRPDQRVFFKGVVRQDVDAQLNLPLTKDVAVIISDPEGKQVSTQTLSVSPFGTFHGELQLEASMKLGTYVVSTEVSAAGHETSRIEGSFDVREYRRPDFKVEINQPTGLVTAGKQLNIGVRGEYYHGSPLGGANVYYEVTRNKLYFQPMPGEWYSYSADDAYDCYWYCRTESGFETVKTGDGKLDDGGNFTVSIPANLTDYKSSATYFVSVTVTDMNQRAVSANAEIPVHKGEFYLGIRPNYGNGWSSSNAEFDIVSVNPDGSVLSNASVSVKLAKRTWSSTKKVNPDGSSTWEEQKTDTPVDSKNLSTDATGRGFVTFTPKEDGEYVATAEARDKSGNLVSASANRYIWRGEGGAVRITDDHQMRIVQSKASYSVGDTASLAVQTPYENGKALVTVERDTIREYRVVDLGSKKRTVDIAIKDDATPNVFVSVLTVAPGKNAVPEFRMGYANLQVNTAKKVLDLKVTTDRSAYRPRDKATVTVETKRNDGTPVQAEVSIAVVDERVVALLGSIDKNILGRFWFPRTIGVQTAQTLTMLVKKVFFATEGGDGKGGNGNVPAVRGNFVDTAYWKADVVTGPDGKATISFDLPDNLTSWQILAIGETKDTVVGSAEAKIVTRRDLMVEPLLPRILRYNDTASVGATVFNATDKPITTKVTISTDGVKVDGGNTRTVSLAAKARQAVTWDIRVPIEGTKANVTITAKGGGFEDGFEQPLPILPYSVSETVSASGILEKTVTETLELPEGILKNQGDVKVSVQPNVGNGLQDGIDYLVAYPYGCAEQKMSGLLGNLMYAELVKLKVSKQNDELAKKASANVEDTIKALVSQQKYDGGWGFWWESERSYPHLTAYVFWGLTQAEKAGFAVDQAVMANAERYLRGALAAPPTTAEWWSRSLQNNEKAQVLFMLSERNAKDLGGYAATLYERRKDLSSFGKAFLAMAYGNLEKGTTSVQAATLLGELQNRLTYLNPSTAYMKEDPGYEEYLSSDLRSSAIYMQALLRLDPKNANVDRMLRYIMQTKKEGYWQSTQATAMTLLSLVEYARANPIDTAAAQVQLYLNNEMTDALHFPQGDVSGEASKTFPMSELLKKGTDVQQVGLEKDSDKRWFYDINMKVFRQVEDIEPFENGFTVLSDVYDLKDKAYAKPLTEVRHGENVRVRLKLLVPKRHRYVALEHHLPAGLEAVDFTLKTTPQYLAGQEKQCAPTYWGGQRCFSSGSWQYDWWWENVWKHIEFRDDRVFLFAENLEPGVYEYEFVATAITPGTFRVPPARAYEFYNPMANAHNEGKILRVIAK
ncbi:MAG TPA: MG2 domain-containing protein [Candidatus Methylomirabilis sp.]|nr:MG2 domain-containing protein [Candidatus Methylomirabilis sp.]